MYEIQKEKVIVNGTSVSTFIRSVETEDFNLVAEVGTTGFKEDSMESYTFLRIFNSGEADFIAHIHEMENGFPQAVDLIFRGNAELAAFVKLMLFATEALTDQITEEAE